MINSMVTGTLLKEAQKMRSEEKMAYRKIAAIMGVPYTTLYSAMNPQARELNRQSCKKYYASHKEDLLADKKKYDWSHKEQISLRKKDRYLENGDVERARSKEYYKLNRESALAKAKNYYKTHVLEDNARSSARRALILGATIGNLAEIKEIYRRAKEDPKVRCYLCGKLIPIGHRHVDHIMPLSKGGAHRPSNLAVSCDICNKRKAAKLPEEIGILL